MALWEISLLDKEMLITTKILYNGTKLILTEIETKWKPAET